MDHADPVFREFDKCSEVGEAGDFPFDDFPNFQCHSLKILLDQLSEDTS